MSTPQILRFSIFLFCCPGALLWFTSNTQPTPHFWATIFPPSAPGYDNDSLYAHGFVCLAFRKPHPDLRNRLRHTWKRKLLAEVAGSQICQNPSHKESRTISSTSVFSKCLYHIEIFFAPYIFGRICLRSYSGRGLPSSKVCSYKFNDVSRHLTITFTYFFPSDLWEFLSLEELGHTT